MGTGNDTDMGIRMSPEELHEVSRSLRKDASAFDDWAKPLRQRLSRAKAETQSGWSSVYDHPGASTLMDNHAGAMTDADDFLAKATADFDNMGRTTTALLNRFGDVDGLNGADIQSVSRAANLPEIPEQ